jgi:endonuclease YncB( thermonuclease family)
MRGYDSPEMKPPRAAPRREEEKAAAAAARGALAAKVGAGALVYAECGEFDKYGRLLVTLYLRAGARNGECVNAWMLAQGHGVPYGGGGRPPWAAA